MAAPSVTNTFTNNTTADASEVNTNFTDLVDYISDRNDGSVAWERCLVTNASSVPLIINNSTGTVNIANFQDNGTNVFQIVDGGNVYMNATKKLFLDGGSNTYITESSNDVISFFTSGTQRVTVSTTALTLANSLQLIIAATKSLILDGSGDTSISETADNQLSFFTAATNRMQINSGGSVILGAQSALATDATDGFAYIPRCAGAPSGTPTGVTGKVPVVYDTTNDKLMVYNGGWVGVTLS